MCSDEKRKIMEGGGGGGGTDPLVLVGATTMMIQTLKPGLILLCFTLSGYCFSIITNGWCGIICAYTWSLIYTVSSRRTFTCKTFIMDVILKTISHVNLLLLSFNGVQLTCRTSFKRSSEIDYYASSLLL